MTVERLALAALTVLAALSAYALVVASGRFGDAAQTFDGIAFELDSFAYERGAPQVDFTLRIDNPGSNAAQIIYIEYAFVVNGVLAGGGDVRPGVAVPPGESESFDLQGRISDAGYLERQPEDEPLRWLVNARLQVSVDDRLDPVFIPFSFRSETP